MATIAQVRDRFAALRLRDEIIRIMYAQEGDILELNKAQLYDNAIDSAGRGLMEYVSLEYAIKKNEQNSRPGFGNPDLYLTGAFYEGFTLDVDKYRFTITSTDSKTFALMYRYGEDIFGLTKEHKRAYALGIFFDAIRQYIEEKTGIPFSTR